MMNTTDKECLDKFVYIKEYTTEAHELQRICIDADEEIEEQEERHKHSRCFPFNAICAMLCCVCCCWPVLIIGPRLETTKYKCCRCISSGCAWIFETFLKTCCCLTDYDCKK